MEQEIDIQKKRQDLLMLSDKTFDMIDQLVESVRAGETIIKGSTLKEVVSFIRLRGELLEKIDEQQQKQAEDNQMSDEEERMLKEFKDVGKQDLEEYSTGSEQSMAKDHFREPLDLGC